MSIVDGNGSVTSYSHNISKYELYRLIESFLASRSFKIYVISKHAAIVHMEQFIPSLGKNLLESCHRSSCI